MKQHIRKSVFQFLKGSSVIYNMPSTPLWSQLMFNDRARNLSSACDSPLYMHQCMLQVYVALPSNSLHRTHLLIWDLSTLSMLLFFFDKYFNNKKLIFFPSITSSVTFSVTHVHKHH